MGLFSKKICDICGGEIKLLGNRKLEDGNLCKNCAAKLSPWFSERRASTVQEIREQLEYREANRAELVNFNITKSLGRGNMKVHVDEDQGKFVVTRARNLQDANPDILDFSQVTACDFSVDEDRTEEKTKDSQGNYISFRPPRYKFSYDFHIHIGVNHKYFNEINFQLNDSGIRTTEEAISENRKPNPDSNMEFRACQSDAQAIVNMLTRGRREARMEAKAAAAPKVAKICPNCGATCIPDANGRCEYCGGAM